MLVVIAGLTLRGQTGIAAWPVRVAMDAENAFGALVYRPISQVRSVLGDIRNLHEMYVENASLKRELQNYLYIEAQLKDEQYTNDQLRKMLNFRRSTANQFNLVSADVVGRDPSEWNSQITIDAGLSDGVRAGMAVISPDGSLIGKVVLAGQFSSKVVLVTDTQLGDGVSARVENGQTDQPFGIVTGSSTDSGQLEMSFLSPLAQVKPGNLVITSGLSNLFPKGLVIGRVARVHSGLQGVTQTALITPTADLGYIQSVLVVESGRTSP